MFDNGCETELNIQFEGSELKYHGKHTIYRSVLLKVIKVGDGGRAGLVDFKVEKGFHSTVKRSLEVQG